MIQINKDNGRLSAWGVAANAVSIRWQKQPSNLPILQHPLDLRGAKIYADFSDGTSEDITGFCSFTPSQGTPVYDEQYVNVTASYVEKSGKTITADTSLPVCYPAELRLVVNSDPLYENYLDTTSPLFDPDTMPFKKGIFKPYCVWKRIDPRTEQEVIIRISPVPEENMFYQYNPDRDGSDVFEFHQFGSDKKWWAISSVENEKEDVEMWHNPFTPTIESFERPLAVLARASVPGDILEATAYIETNPIKLTYDSLPTSFVDGVPTHFSKDNIRFSWGGSDPVSPTELNDLWIGVNMGVPVWGSDPQDELDYTFENGDEMDFCPTRLGPGYFKDVDNPYEYTQYHCVCADNKIEWTIIEE